MATLNARFEKEDAPKECPRCKHELIVIDGNLVKWLTCTNCKWKKLAGKEDKVIKITPMRDVLQSAPEGPQRLKVSFDRD
jgi:ribosomal protein L37AE/L43A